MNCDHEEYDNKDNREAEASRSQRSQPHALKGWHSRGYLPHRDEIGILQSITFRLADSLPQEMLKQLEAELLKLSEDERVRQQRIEIENWLDSGMGCCALRHLAMAEIVQNALMRDDGARYCLLAWCVMPNHVHVLIKAMAPLAKIVCSWKGFTGHWAIANNATMKLGIISKQFWQHDYWDRFMRNEDHYANTIDYIHNNPVKAGLCATAADWRWSSAGSARLPPREKK